MSKRKKIKPPIQLKLLRDFLPFPLDYVEEGEGDCILRMGGVFRDPNPNDTLTVAFDISIEEVKDD